MIKRVSLLFALLLLLNAGTTYFLNTSDSQNQHETSQNGISNSTSSDKTKEQRVFVDDSGAPPKPNILPPIVQPDDVIKLSAGVQLSLIDGPVKPSQYSTKVLDSEPLDYEREMVWAYVSDVIDAGNLEQFYHETVCTSNGKSTGCPYFYFQTSYDLKNWKLLSVSNESPPRVGKTTYSTRDLSTASHGPYFRFVLHSKECEQNVCREGTDLSSNYEYTLNVMFN